MPFPELGELDIPASFFLDGLPLQTGDLICTSNGDSELGVGEFWRFIGRLLPGEVDHIVIYLGPGGWCVEAGMHGVILFEVPGQTWDARAMIPQRGHFVDTLVGVAYPLQGRGIGEDEERSIRLAVRRFGIEQARSRKPYNLNFLNPCTEGGFYCSQLPYCAYLRHDIDLNTGVGMPDLPGSDAIIFPQEIWSGCEHKAVGS